ncbi:MAG: alkaline phosphatase family protein, partial [bacterium]
MERNCIVFVVDSLRFDAYSGTEKQGLLERWGLAKNLDTPNMDRLAGKGVEVPNLHAPAPFTPPSVATIVSGL